VNAALGMAYGGRISLYGLLSVFIAMLGHASVPPGLDATTWVAPGGSDSAACSRAAPCQTLAGAIARTATGGQVLVVGGRYGSQKLPPAVGGRGVVVRPAGSAPVELGELVIMAADVEVRDLTVSDWSVDWPARDVVLRRVTSLGAVFVTSADHVRVLGGAVTPRGYLQNGSQVKTFNGFTEPPRDIVFDGVTFRGFRKAPGSGAHVDCLHVMAVDGLVVSRSRFSDCEAFDLLFTVYGDAGSPRNILVENNAFQCCRSGYYSMMLGGGHGERWENVTVRYNSSDNSMNVAPQSEAVGVRFIGNAGPPLPAGACRAGVTAAFNVWTSPPACGATDRVASLPFAAASSGDFRLTRCSAASGHGDAAAFPATDLTGAPRPVDRPADAGAFQGPAGCR
jgi:hypothetical protein